MLDRREFLRVSGTAAGGLLLAVAWPRIGSARESDASWEANAFVLIDADGAITITVARPDMGQGVRTSLSAIVAEELDADWAMVRVAQADLAPARYGDQYSGGSSSVRSGWDPLRRAGATARAMLVAAAAAQWGVPTESCTTEKSAVLHAASERRMAYGALTAAAALLPVPAEAPLKQPGDYRLVGTRIPSVDAPAIVRGELRFGLDQRVPGMLFAVVERAPTIGAKIAKVDDAKARATPGVRRVVTIDADALPSFGSDNPRPRNGVGVVATSTWAALTGRRALGIAWTPGPGATESSARSRAEAVTLAAQPPHRVAIAVGDVDVAMQGAAKVVEASYDVPLLAHAPMEPMNCVADARNGRCTVWAPIQNPSGARQALERALGLAPEAITVHPVRSGGGFGRRFYNDFVVEAALLSRAANAPVQVVWTREDDVRCGFYRPANHFAMRAGLDAHGAMTAWSLHFVNAARGEFLEWDLPSGVSVYPAGMGEYDRGDFPNHFIPNFRLQASRLQSRIPLGQWRAIDWSSSAFAIESFFDEVAHAARRDFLEMKLDMLSRPLDPAAKMPLDASRLAAVYRLAAERGDWGKPLPPGRGRGIAGGFNNGAYVAEVAEVTVNAQGTVKVDRVVAAVDSGRIVNRSGAEAQVSGAIVYGLSAALMERITVENGAVQQSNFHDFPALRMAGAPRIEVHFVEGSAPPSGMGEGALPAAAPAVGNAIFAATGVRRRSLPFDGKD